MECCAVVEFGTSNVLFTASYEECTYFVDTDVSGKRLVILFGDEDIPEEWT